MINYTERIPKPADNSINTGLSYCKQSTMLNIFGAPRTEKCVDCKPPTNPKLKRQIVTENVGPFSVTGLKQAVDSLRRVFERVKAEEPVLYSKLSTAGMLCCRLVRDSKTNWSNHSWGTAIDLKIDGVLDKVDDGMCLRGLLILYKYFRNEGWYWGSEFKREDSMHFEVADETIRRWQK